MKWLIAVLLVAAVVASQWPQEQKRGDRTQVERVATSVVDLCVPGTLATNTNGVEEKMLVIVIACQREGTDE